MQMAKSTFIVNWEVQGFRAKTHAVGAFIVAEAEEVKDLVEAGAVSLWDKVKGQKVAITATVTDTTAEDALHKFLMETSGGFHTTDADWTTVGRNSDGFPVAKGSPEDVSVTE
jgi:glycine/serine hydroxymethyltransferase